MSTDKPTGKFKLITSGKPNPVAEPAFLAILPRKKTRIWHKVEGTFTCKNGVPEVTAALTGSPFPSHKAWLFSLRTKKDKWDKKVDQGAFDKLWALDDVPEL